MACGYLLISDNNAPVLMPSDVNTVFSYSTSIP